MVSRIVCRVMIDLKIVCAAGRQVLGVIDLRLPVNLLELSLGESRLRLLSRQMGVGIGTIETVQEAAAVGGLAGR